MQKRIFRILSLSTFTLGTFVNGLALIINSINDNPESVLILISSITTAVSILCALTIPMWHDELIFKSKEELDKIREEYIKETNKIKEFLRKRKK